MSFVKATDIFPNVSIHNNNFNNKIIHEIIVELEQTLFCDLNGVRTFALEKHHPNR